MTENITRKHADRGNSQSFPTYSDLLTFSSTVIEEAEVFVENSVIFPSYAEFLNRSTTEEPDIDIVLLSYSEFLSYSTAEDEADVEQATIVPSYADFLSRSSVEKLFEELIQDDAELDDTDEDGQPVRKTRAEKVGLGLSIAGLVVGIGSIGVSAATSRNVEIYMFVPAILAIILSIVGERLNRNTRNGFYIDTIMFSVFTLVFPLILSAVGWLALP